MRMMIAAAEPITIAFLLLRSERAASAITTALSPDSRMLTQMIWSSAIQNAAELSSIPSFLDVIP